MDDKEFEELKTQFYIQDWYTLDELEEYMKTVLGDEAGKKLAETIRKQPQFTGGKIPKEYMACALAVALDATHHKNPKILTNARWILTQMRHYDKRV